MSELERCWLLGHTCISTDIASISSQHYCIDSYFGDLAQLAEDPQLCAGAVAASIISICNLIHATWPDTSILLAGVLVGGLRGDNGEARSHKLPNRYA